MYFELNFEKEIHYADSAFAQSGLRRRRRQRSRQHAADHAGWSRNGKGPAGVRGFCVIGYEQGGPPHHPYFSRARRVARRAGEPGRSRHCFHAFNVSLICAIQLFRPLRSTFLHRLRTPRCSRASDCGHSGFVGEAHHRGVTRQIRALECFALAAHIARSRTARAPFERMLPVGSRSGPPWRHRPDEVTLAPALA